jgi:hypothetical protein
MRTHFAPFIAIAASAIFSSGLRGQGNLSTQGFGYPLGGISARAAGTGGASAEFDALSSRNPAALPGWGRPGIYVQYDPEFRIVSLGDSRERSTVPRFGAMALAFAIGRRTVLGLSTHSFLDRTFGTDTRSFERLGGDSIPFSERFRSSGAIQDSRLGVSYALSPRIVIGAGLHVFSGENRLNLTRKFDDSLRFGTLTRALTLSYSGVGASAGFVVTPVRWLSLAGSAREGGTIRLRIIDTLQTEAKVPNRYGLAARLDALPGVSLLVSADHEQWSRLNGLGSVDATARDAWEYAVGAEFAGQKTRASSWSYSLGYRQRDLPFLANGVLVSEKGFSAGTSIPIAGPRAALDVALQRAIRDASGGARERAWLLSIGLSVHP